MHRSKERSQNDLPNSRIEERFWAGLTIAVSALVVIDRLSVIYRSTLDYVLDDSFMSFVYARNFAEGRGLVFNLGEHIYGFTSPLYVLLLSFLPALGLEQTYFAPVINLCLPIVYGVIWFYIGTSFFNLPCRFLLGVIAAIMPFEIGMESSLLLLLQSLFIWCVIEKKAVPAAIVASLSCLARPDSILLVIPILFMTRIAFNRKAFLFFSVPGIVWVLFTLFYYGDVLPNSFYGKEGQTPFLPGLSQIVGTMVDWSTFVPSINDFSFFRKLNLMVGLFPLAFLFFPKNGERPRWLFYALVAYPWVLVFSYAYIGPPLAHNWEQISAFFFFRVGCAFGAFTLWKLISEHLPLQSKKMRYAVGAFSFFIFFWVGPRHVYRIEQSVFLDRKISYYVGHRQQTYFKISQWLNENVNPNWRIAMGEPGTIAYFTRMPVLDLGWLVSRKKDLPTSRAMLPELALLVGNPEVQQLFGLNADYKRLRHFEKNHGIEFTVMKRVD